jgi:hypothetical protein
MKMILNEAADVASRKRAVQFLVNNFDRCFPLDKRKTHMTDEMKKHEAEEYVKNVLKKYCHPIDLYQRLSWTKNLVEGLVRILKLECNNDTDRPANKKMMEQLKKLYFAATMYRQSGLQLTSMVGTSISLIEPWLLSMKKLYRSIPMVMEINSRVKPYLRMK